MLINGLFSCLNALNKAKCNHRLSFRTLEINQLDLSLVTHRGYWKENAPSMYTNRKKITKNKFCRQCYAHITLKNVELKESKKLELKESKKLELKVSKITLLGPNWGAGWYLCTGGLSLWALILDWICNMRLRTCSATCTLRSRPSARSGAEAFDDQRPRIEFKIQKRNPPNWIWIQLGNLATKFSSCGHYSKANVRPCSPMSIELSLVQKNKRCITCFILAAFCQ